MSMRLGATVIWGAETTASCSNVIERCSGSLMERIRSEKGRKDELCAEKRQDEQTKYLVCVDRLGLIVRVVDVRVFVI